MTPENFPYHFSAIASIVADIWVGILALRVWKARGSKGFFYLAVTCGLFLVGSVYGYLVGLAEYGFFQWPLDDRGTYRAYLLTSFISLASQIVFIVAIIRIIREYLAKPYGGDSPGANGFV